MNHLTFKLPVSPRLAKRSFTLYVVCLFEGESQVVHADFELWILLSQRAKITDMHHQAHNQCPLKNIFFSPLY